MKKNKKDKIIVKIKRSKKPPIEDNIDESERGDIFDELYGYDSHIKPLSRGVVREDTYNYDEEIYEKVKQLASLEKKIKEKKNILRLLQSKINDLDCPNNNEILAYCNKIIKVSKGKIGDK